MTDEVTEIRTNATERISSANDNTASDPAVRDDAIDARKKVDIVFAVRDSVLKSEVFIIFNVSIMFFLYNRNRTGISYFFYCYNIYQ